MLNVDPSKLKRDTIKVQTEFALDQVGLDFDGALERLSAGTQKSKLSAADQKQLYQDFNDVQGLTSSSFRLVKTLTPIIFVFDAPSKAASIIFLPPLR